MPAEREESVFGLVSTLSLKSGGLRSRLHGTLPGAEPERIERATSGAVPAGFIDIRMTLLAGKRLIGRRQPGEEALGFTPGFIGLPRLPVYVNQFLSGQKMTRINVEYPGQVLDGRLIVTLLFAELGQPQQRVGVY